MGPGPFPRKKLGALPLTKDLTLKGNPSPDLFAQRIRGFICGPTGRIASAGWNFFAGSSSVRPGVVGWRKEGPNALDCSCLCRKGILEGGPLDGHRAAPSG
jgi:hypothetical protein